MNDERFERGTAVRADVLGPEYVAARATQTTADPVILRWRRYLAEEGWGGVWARPDLPNRTKSLVTVVALAAGGYSHELELHLVGAIRNGWTATELGEVLIHLSSYVGYPPIVEAFRVAERVFAREDVGVAEGATTGDGLSVS
jgi:alkylhydroperoxidase/carboxymuconolactone decarboxylase family protein YurZ